MADSEAVSGPSNHGPHWPAQMPRPNPGDPCPAWSLTGWKCTQLRPDSELIICVLQPPSSPTFCLDLSLLMRPLTATVPQLRSTEPLSRTLMAPPPPHTRSLPLSTLPPPMKPPPIPTDLPKPLLRNTEPQPLTHCRHTMVATKC